MSFPPRCFLHAATLSAALSLTPALRAADLEVRPGTFFAVDVLAPNSPGPYTLVQFDATGAILGTKVLVDPFSIGIPTGVAILGGDVFVSGTNNLIAQVDLESGELFGAFPSGLVGTEDLGTWKGNLVATTWRQDEVRVYTREGTLVDTITLSPHSELTGVDSDGTYLYTSNWNDGDIDVYDLGGTFLYSIPTGIGPQSASGLDYQRSTGTLWVTTGFGSDEIREYAPDGTLLNTFPAVLPMLNGIDHGDDPLILNAEPNFAIAGDDLEFHVHEGVPGNALLHAITSLDGVPLFHPLMFGGFALDGTFDWSAPVPPGLANLVIGHRAFALDASGKMQVSNEELVFHH